MRGDTGKFPDKGKNPVISERKVPDFSRMAAQQQDRLELDSSRRFLPGGSGQGESSNHDSNYVKNKIEQMNENKENKSKKYNDLIEKGKEVYKEAKANEEYKNYSDKHGGTKHYH